MKKYTEPSSHDTLMEFIEKEQKEFWETHKLIRTEYYIHRTAYCIEDDYGSSDWVPAKDLFGPYIDKSEAEKDLEKLLSNPRNRPRHGFLKVREARLVETTVTKQFWI